MLFALFHISWLVFPLVFVTGLVFGMMINFDPRLCPAQGVPAPTKQTSAYQEQAKQSLIRICQGIDQRNPQMLTPQCIQALYPGGRP